MTNSEKKISLLEIIIVCASVWILFFLLLLLLTEGKYFLLGGEGNYFLDVFATKENYFYSWISINNGTGYPNPVLSFPVGIFNIFSWLDYIGIPSRIANIFMVSLVYALPFSSMFWMLRKILEKSLLISFLLSLFYIINPFSTIHLHSMMFWNIAPLFVLPLAFGIVYTYYPEKFRMFFFFGLATAALSFSFANPPYLGIFHFFILFTAIIIPYWKNKKFKIRTLLKTFALLESSFILFNSWWLINLIRIQTEDMNDFYSEKFAVSWVKLAGGNESIMENILSLRVLAGEKSDYFFSDFYNNLILLLFFFIPFFILTFHLSKIFKSKRDTIIKKIIPLISFFAIVTGFLSKGVNEPLGRIYLWLMENIPLFIIFKSPQEKFSLFFIFLTTFLLAIILKGNTSKTSLRILSVYLLICAYPFLSLNFIPDYKFEEGKYISRKFDYKKEYFETKEMLNRDRLDYRYLSLPGSLNYQVTIKNHDSNKYYRGMDPLVYSINKPFLAAYSDLNKFDIIFNNLSSEKATDILNLYNIRKILLNGDIYPAFGFKEKEKAGDILRTFSKSYKLDEDGSLNIFSNRDFLPHIYTPKNVVISQRNTSEFFRILDNNNLKNPLAVFFDIQNIRNKEVLDKLEEKFSKEELTRPIIEFKKINQTKYRVRVHKAREEFPLVFSESFHRGWKAYLVNPSWNNDQNISLNDYKILDGNFESQASAEELGDYLKNGWVTSLGRGEEQEIEHVQWNTKKQDAELSYKEKYHIDFISKNFQNTIQNNNLPDQEFYETWSSKNALPIEDKNHLLVNTYGNSWLIDIKNVCKNSTDPLKKQYGPTCFTNPDGSYDFELVIEFYPQRLIYFGIGITSLTFIACLLTFILKLYKEHRKEEAID